MKRTEFRVITVSKENTASMFRVEECAKEETSINRKQLDTEEGANVLPKRRSISGL
jgi:hypothetical protein